MEIKEITASRKTRVTTGHNFNFDSVELFFSANATITTDEDEFEATQELQSFVNASLNREVKTYTETATSTAQAVAERNAEANEDSVPRVSAPAKTQSDYVAKTTAPTSDGTSFTSNGPDDEIHSDDLTVGDLKNKVPLVCKVTKVWPGGDRGPKHGKTIFDGGVLETAHFDAPPQWSEGDTVAITNAFKVDEYNGTLQLNMGKFAKVEVLSSAPPAQVDQWA